MRGENEAVQLIGPKHRYEKMVYSPYDDLPLYPECKDAQIIVEALLDEGESY